MPITGDLHEGLCKAMSTRRTKRPLHLFNLEPGKQRHLSEEQAASLLRSGCFKPSIGIQLWAEHYRCSLTDGSCLHLVIWGNRAKLHRDRWDPHRDPVSLLLHCFKETPIGAAAVIVGLSFLLPKALAR